jgi:PAS domain S-box-containing protein
MKLHTRFNWYLIGIGMLASVLINSSLYFTLRNTLLNHIDSHLVDAAELARHTLPPNYHDIISNDQSVSASEYATIVDRYNRITHALGLEFLTSVMVMDDSIIYTSASSPAVATFDNARPEFYELHKHPEIYEQAIATLKPVFLETNDVYGRTRVAFVPHKDIHGRTYLFAAGQRTSLIEAELRKTVEKSIASSLAILFISLLLSFFLSNSLVQPIESLTVTANQIASGQYGKVVSVGGGKELESLSHSLSTLSITIQEKIAEITETRDEYFSLIQTSPDSIVVIDQEGLITYVSARTLDLIGSRSESEVIGKSIFSFINIEDHDRARETMEDMRIGRTNPNSCFKILRANGETFTGDVNGRLIRDKAGHPKGFIIIIRDVTQRSIAEEALRDSERKFRTLFENMTEGVALYEMIYDDQKLPVDYLILDYNPAFIAFSGYDPETTIGRRASEAYGSPLWRFQEYASVAATGLPYRYETYHPKTGRHFIVSTISPKPGQFATVLEDITALKQKEEELRLRSDELMRFNYAVSHDLKSPLVTIHSFLGYLEQDIKRQDQDRIDRSIDFIRKASTKMSNMLDELLNLSRIGSKSVPRENISLQSIVAEAIEMVAGRIAVGDVSIRITEMPVMLYGERQRLVEIFLNLIDNAVKYMGDQPDPQIEIAANIDEEQIVFFVRDNGMGIEPHHQKNLFMLFEKIDPASEGSGMGLALIKRIIEIHGGRIWLHSEGAGKGSTFYFTLANSHLNEQQVD